MEDQFTLDGSKTYTTGGSVDENIITLLDLSANNQCAVTRGSSDEESSSVLERPSFGHGKQRILNGGELGGECSLGGTKDSSTNGVTGVGRFLGCRDNYTSEFGASNPRECCDGGLE